MVMEFDQYLQPCDVTDNRYLAVYDSVPKPQPLIDVYREAAVGVGAQPASVPPYSSTENEPAVGVDDSAAAPTENRCVWACNFDHDDTETILTSETDDIDSVPDIPSATSAGRDRRTAAESPSSSATASSPDAWSSFSAVKVDASPWSSPPIGHRRKHQSLPANLPSLLRNSELRTAEHRRRHPSTGVRFADEVGENLMTFAIIPSRHDIDRVHQQTHAEKSQSTTVLGRASTTSSSHGRRLHLIDHYRAMASFGIFGTDTTSWLSENLSSSSLSSDDEDRGPSSRQPAFQLSFDQPAADPASFQRRLDGQMVCLENVKVVSDVALCSVRVRCVDCARSTRRVLARCTNDDWLSFADIAAHPVSVGVPVPSSADRNGSRGALDERLSFAVRRPKFKRSAAVEFALCYRADDKTWWDNNNGRNYRVEWLR